MLKSHEKTIEVLKGSSTHVDYEIDGDKIIINDPVELDDLYEVPDDFLANTVVKSSISIPGLRHAPAGFLRNTVVEGQTYLRTMTSFSEYFLEHTQLKGGLYLPSLRKVETDFSKNLKCVGTLYLSSVESVPQGFLQNCTIDGSLSLPCLRSAPVDFLKGSHVREEILLMSLESAQDGSLEGITAGSTVGLRRLREAPEGFLKNSVIDGCLSLYSLEHIPEGLLDNSVVEGTLFFGDRLYESVEHFARNSAVCASALITLSQPLSDQGFPGCSVTSFSALTPPGGITCGKLDIGYNKEKGYCYFDGILSRVLSVHQRGEFTLYKTPFEYVVQKGRYTAHSKSAKQGIIDVNFKEYVASLEHEKLSEDDEVSVDLYRAITGACYIGISKWLTEQNIKFDLIEDRPVLKKNIKARDALKLLRDTGAYGWQKFEKLIEDPRSCMS